MSHEGEQLTAMGGECKGGGNSAHEPGAVLRATIVSRSLNPFLDLACEFGAPFKGCVETLDQPNDHPAQKLGHLLDLSFERLRIDHLLPYVLQLIEERHQTAVDLSHSFQITE